MEHSDLIQTHAQTRLLVVDDENSAREPMVKVLQLEGYNVDEADSGYKALELLKTNTYDLMLIDIRMPGLDGVELMQRIHHQYPEVLMMVLTGYASVESAITAVKTGVIDYLNKPISMHEIVTTVRQTLKRHAAQLNRRHLLTIIGEAADALRIAEKPQVETTSEAEIIAERFIKVGELILDQKKMIIYFSDTVRNSLQLTVGECTLMACLMQDPGRVLTSSQLAFRAWGYTLEEDAAQGTVRPHMSRLRRKLTTTFSGVKLIHTIRSKGYLFTIKIEE